MGRFDELKEQVLDFRDARDWSQFHTLKNLSMALSIEAAELEELMLWKSDEDIQASLKDTEFQENLQQECADILNYLVLIAHAGNFDIVDAALSKTKVNNEKYPVEKSRGTATKHNKL